MKCRCLLLALCVVAAGSSSIAQDNSPPLDRFATAFNEHDARAMASMVTEDFQLFYVNAEGKAELATSGPRALEEEMQQYFAGRLSTKRRQDPPCLVLPGSIVILVYH